MRKLLILIVPFLLCSCVSQNYNATSAHQNIGMDLAAMGVDDEIVTTDLEKISREIVGILHDNFSLDDTFVISGDTSNRMYSILIPAMKLSGFKVFLGQKSDNPNYFQLNYSFTVTNNHLIETPDVALLRLWVGDEFQLSKAFTWSIDGLQDKTAYSVIGR